MDTHTAQSAIAHICAQMGLQTDIKVSEIKGDRWTLVYDQSEHHPDVGRHMIRMERIIRNIMGFENVELMCEAEADKNKRDVRTGRGSKMVNARNVEKLD